jgi:hypothetical protein
MNCVCKAKLKYCFGKRFFVLPCVKAEITVDVKHCARCGKDHEKVIFKKLTQPGPRHSHWAPCPTNQEPIMMRVVEMQMAEAKIESESAGVEHLEIKSFVFSKE